MIHNTNMTAKEKQLLSELDALRKENVNLRQFVEDSSLWEEKKKDMALRVAKETVKRDPKAIANTILNMTYEYHTPVSFCEIFDLMQYGCGEKYNCCTDCIHAFLQREFEPKKQTTQEKE